MVGNNESTIYDKAYDKNPQHYAEDNITQW